MMGLPFETEENILASADFCKKVKTKSMGISIFVPYHGTKPRKVCVKYGFIEDKYDENISVRYSSVLKMPQLSRKKIDELYYNFNNLVYGKSKS